jgi:hypothetical protein
MPTGQPDSGLEGAGGTIVERWSETNVPASRDFHLSAISPSRAWLRPLDDGVHSARGSRLCFFPLRKCPADCQDRLSLSFDRLQMEYYPAAGQRSSKRSIECGDSTADSADGTRSGIKRLQQATATQAARQARQLLLSNPDANFAALSSHFWTFGRSFKTVPHRDISRPCSLSASLPLHVNM